MRYTVKVDDNFHFMDESECREAGSFDTAEAAIIAAQNIVDKSLRHIYKAGMNPVQIYKHYEGFGENPFVITDDKKFNFSAGQYARSQSSEICNEFSRNTSS